MQRTFLILHVESSRICGPGQCQDGVGDVDLVIVHHAGSDIYLHARVIADMFFIQKAAYLCVAANRGQEHHSYFLALTSEILSFLLRHSSICHADVLTLLWLYSWLM